MIRTEGSKGSEEKGQRQIFFDKAKTMLPYRSNAQPKDAESTITGHFLRGLRSLLFVFHSAENA
jgi:hypothetical protein